jgi:hypothetical protein
MVKFRRASTLVVVIASVCLIPLSASPALASGAVRHHAQPAAPAKNVQRIAPHGMHANGDPWCC